MDQKRLTDSCRAFISYRHKPLDIKIAKDVQKRLEHFHVPGDILKLPGVKPIGRIFRDQNELPVTDNIQEDIQQALSEAEYLIVICSSNTSKSTWVTREICCFLEHHDRKHVVTVLADGNNPGDVIPDILLHDDEGNPLEPLSCDYRSAAAKEGKNTEGSVRIAPISVRRQEITRLAAALLCCSLDTLMQRQHQYEMRKLMLRAGIVFSLLLAFTSLAVSSSRKLGRSNRNLLRSRSRYLAGASETAMKNGKAVLARLLALEAVPLKENVQEFPLKDLGSAEDDSLRLPELYHALFTSTLAGDSPYEHEAAEGRVQAFQTVRACTQGEVRSARIYPDSGRFAVIDEFGEMVITDLLTGAAVSRETYSVPNISWLLQEPAFYDYTEDSVVLLLREGDYQFILTEVSLQDGKVLRTREVPGYTGVPAGLIVLPAAEGEAPDLVLAVSSLQTQRGAELLRLKGDSWEPEQKAALSFKDEHTYVQNLGAMSLASGVLSTDGKHAVFAGYSESGGALAGLASWNLETGETAFWSVSGLDAEEVTDENAPEDIWKALSREKQAVAAPDGRIIFTQTVYRDTWLIRLAAFDPAENTIAWTCTLSDGQGFSEPGSLCLSQDKTSVLAAVGPDIFDVRIADGKILRQHTFDHRVLSIGTVTPEYADVCLDSGENIRQPWEGSDAWLLGEIASERQPDSFCQLENALPAEEDGQDAANSRGKYIAVEGKEAGIYDRYAGDRDLQLIEVSGKWQKMLPEQYWTEQAVSTESGLVFVLHAFSDSGDRETDQKSSVFLACVDPQERKMKWLLPFPGIETVDSFGVSEDGAACFLICGGSALYTVNMENGKAVPVNSLKDENGQRTAVDYSMHIFGDYLCRGGFDCISVWSLPDLYLQKKGSETGRKIEIDPGSDVTELWDAIGCDPKAKIMYCGSSSGAKIAAVPMDEKAEKDPQVLTLSADPDFMGTPFLAVSPSGGAAAFWTDRGGTMRIFHADTGETSELSSYDVDPAGCAFYGSQLILVPEEGETAFRYDAQTGSLLGQFMIGSTDRNACSAARIYPLTGSVILLELDFSGENTFLLIDTEDWVLLGTYQGEVFSANTEEIYSIGRTSEKTGADAVYSYPVYTLGQLIEKAETLSGESAFTREEELSYGK